MRWLWFFVYPDGARLEVLMPVSPSPGLLVGYLDRIDAGELRSFGADEVAA